MSREKVKTIILTVLVFLSIYLTQRIWFISPVKILESQASNFEINQEKILEIRKECLRPVKMNINLGGYHVNPAYNNDIWQLSKGILTEYFLGEPDVSISTLERYEEQRGFKSIELCFGENIPSVLISSIFGSLDNKVVRNIKEIERIVIPAMGNGDIYIFSNIDTIFRIYIADFNKDLTRELFQHIEAQNYNRYYPLFIDIGNPVLMPLSFNNPIPHTYIDSIIDINSEEDVVEHAKVFFDRNFDFIKTIKETSGATLFIYGYGEKSVRINNRGRLEYNEDVGTASSTNIINAIDVAINFALKHGNFPEGTYLKEIRPIERNKGYYFGFHYRINNRPLHFADNNISNTIEIEVYGDKVRSYRSFIRQNTNQIEIQTEEQMLLPHKIIDANFDMIKEDYLNRLEDEEYKDEKLLNDIKSVNLVYLDTLEQTKNQLAYVCWRIEVGATAYYFNAYNGELVYKTLTN